MQIRRIWGFQETHETRTPKHSKSEEGRPLSCQALVRTAGGFFVLSTVHIGACAYFVPQSLLVMVIAFSMPFDYTCLAISGKENSTMPATRNLCAQLPLDLHQRVCEAREESGLTTAQYITNLLLEYYEMKENGGNAAMTNGKNRTLAFQIDEELFQRIKAHLERESARLGRKVTQREFILNAIIGVLNMSEPMDVDEAGVSPCEAGAEDGSAQPQEEDTPAV